MGGRGERMQEGVVGFLGRYYGTQENEFDLLFHHSFPFVGFAGDFQSVGMLGEYWGLHPSWGALSLDMHMQFLQGAELQNGPNLEAWVASEVPGGAGTTEIQRSWALEEMVWRPLSQHFTQQVCGCKEAQCPSGWCFKWEQKKFGGYSFTGSAGLLQKHLHLCVWAQSKAVRCKEEVPNRSAEQFCWRCGDFKRNSFPPASQA